MDISRRHSKTCQLGYKKLEGLRGDPASLRKRYRMSHFNLERAIRPNILALHPYRCARDDYQEGVLLDANENSLGHSIATSKEDVLDSELFNASLHRYPDPSQQELKSKIAQLRSIAGPEYVFLGVGSDEVIDLLMRITCVPGSQGDAILITPPTYGMYAVCAQVNDVKVLKVNLNLDFSLDLPKASPKKIFMFC